MQAGKKSRISRPVMFAAGRCTFTKEAERGWSSDVPTIRFAERTLRNLSKMKCPHLSKLADWSRTACKACEKPYLPTSFQVKEYCKSFMHIRCPFYLNLRERLEDKAFC